MEDDIAHISARLILLGFDGLSPIASSARAAKLYKTFSAEHQLDCVVKFYQDWRDEGMEARDFFVVELEAMMALAQTRRVPAIVHQEVLLVTDKKDQILRRLYFIIKPYYKSFLGKELRDTPPLQRLEYAAQQADISLKFWIHGWRDFDGSFMNDAIDEEGRLVRVDLDSAKPEFNRKFQPKFQTHDDAELINRWLLMGSVVFSEPAEVSSLAVRVSRLLLHNDEVDWDALRAVTALRDAREDPRAQPQAAPTAHAFPGPPRRTRLSEGGGKLLRGLTKLWHRLYPLMPPMPPSITEQGAQGQNDDAQKNKEEPEPGPSPEEAALEKWWAAWRSIATRREGAAWWAAKLTESEARLLARLTFHMLSRRDHGFRIYDFYLSLMLMTLAAIDYRNQEFTRGGAADTEDERPKFDRLVGGFREVRAFLESHAPVGAGADGEEISKPPPPQPKYKAVKIVCRGGAWPATKKGPEWKCQDFVKCSEGEPAPFFVLADGASRAGGAEAIKIVEEIVNGWGRRERYSSPAEAREELCRLVKQIHDALLRFRKRAANKAETTLVAATIYNGPPAPELLIVRYGDSGWLLTQEHAGESLDEIDDTIHREEFPAPLGSRNHSAFDPRDVLASFKLGIPGRYRLRAYSDGIGKEEQEVRDLLGGVKGIEDLTEEAARWNDAYGRIGADDWSVAGLDIEVVEDIPIGSPHRDEARAAKTVPPFPWASLAKVDATAFRLSQPVRQLWQSLLLKDPELYELAYYPLIKSVFNASPGPKGAATQPRADGEEKPRPAEGATQAGTQRPHRPAPRERDLVKPLAEMMKDNVVPIVLVAIVSGLLVAVIYQVFLRGDSGGGTGEMNTNLQVNPATPSPTPLRRFSDERQNSIYSTLNAGRVYKLTGLVGGAEINGEPLRSFLPDLARVLRDTDMNVLIKVYTDPSGTSEGNLKNTKARAEAIKKSLVDDWKIRPERIEMKEMGGADPDKPENKKEDRPLNRRLEITRKSS